MHRRALVRRAASLAAAGAAGLAGCAGGDGGGGSPTPAPTSPTPADGTVAGAVDSYLSDADNFDGTVTDATGESTARVSVGSRGNGGYFGFGPPALRVDAGTSVVWVWSGKGERHNVVAEDDAFSSDLVAEATHTFSRTLDEPGLVRYYCAPHRSLGMKGVVVVV